MKIFSGTGSTALTNAIVDKLNEHDKNLNLGRLQIDKFSDGEILPLFRESIRDEDVFFINSTNSCHSIIETLMVIDAAKRAGCRSFTLVAPFQGYSRQDKTDHLRSSIGSKVMADILEKVGMSRIITIDLHASAIQGFYNVPVIHLNGNKIFIDYIRSLNLRNLCILAPDQGAVKRATDFYKAFPESSFAMINKKRIKPNEIHSMELVGDVEGKNVLVVDDIADTLGTIKSAADIITSRGAASVRALATHGVLSGKAYENLEASKLTELIISDSVPQNNSSNKLNVICCAKVIADSIIAITQKRSIHEINVVNEYKV